MAPLTALVEFLAARRLAASQARRIAHQAERIRTYRHELADKTAELVLLREAVDRAQAQAAGYRREVARLSVTNSSLMRRVEEQRDQLDAATGAVREPAAIEALLADLAELPTTDEVEYPR